MIAIIIAESDNFIEKISHNLSKKGFTIIRYHWLLKALDNLEEINPDKIYINALDYPRHWKTLVLFANGGLFQKKPEIYLYDLSQFNEEEIEKASCLNVRIIQNIDSIETLDEFKSNIDIKDIDNKDSEDSKDKKSDNTQMKKEKSSVESLLLINPHTQNLILGSIVLFKNKSIIFKYENNQSIDCLKTNDLIEKTVLKINNQVSEPVLKITSIQNQNLHMEIL